LREPHVGIRFGVEIDDSLPGKPYVLRQRDPHGLKTGAEIQLTLTPQRVIPVRAQVVPKLGTDDARLVAIQLMRPPYVQRFGNTIQETDVKPVTVVNVPESRGLEDPPPDRPLGGGRFMNIANLRARAETIQKLGKN
jgi:hypothetical protein